MGSVRLQLEKAALEYMDQTAGLDKVKNTCHKYSLTQSVTYHFTVLIEPCDLVDLNVSLGNLVLNHPDGAVRVFQEVIYAGIVALELLPKCTSSTQVAVAFCLQDLPPLPCYQMGSVKDMVQWHVGSKRFLCYKGVVCGLSPLHKYTKSARFVCPLDDCPGSQGNKYIRLHIPGAREAQTIRGDFTCSHCGSTLEEDISCRVLEDKVVVELMDEAAFVPHMARHQSLPAFLRGDLAHGCVIGQTLEIIGLPVLDVNQKFLALEVNNIIGPSSKLTLMEEPALLSDLPESIRMLHEDRRETSWGFTLGLAYAFGAEVTPPGTFLSLKLGMLLSLVQTPLGKRNTALDLLVVGSESLGIERLLRQGSLLASRVVVHSRGCHLTAAFTKDRHSSGAGFVEGGSLLLAHGGICLIPHLGQLKKADKEHLLQVLETGSVPVDSEGKHISQQVRQCAVWGLVEHSGSGVCSTTSVDLNISLTDPVQTPGKKGISRSLLDVFGLVYMVDMEPACYADFLLTNYTLQAAMNQPPHTLITQEEFRKFLEVARSLPVTLTAAAGSLIRGYYVASRRVRASGVHPSTLPVTAVGTITKLAEAHTKLNLRSEVTELDAVLAVYLYEESISMRQGGSLLPMDPIPHIKDNNLDSYIGRQRDIRIKHFHQALLCFIDQYAED